MSSSLTEYLLDQIKWLGYDIDIKACRISAKDQDSGELYIVSIDNDDHYTAACTLSEMVGIELQDNKSGNRIYLTKYRQSVLYALWITNEDRHLNMPPYFFDADEPIMHAEEVTDAGGKCAW